jgi:ATP-dependent protease ClpP protease subunit
MQKTMSKEDRIKIIQSLETERNSRVLCYVTGDRPSYGMGTPSLAAGIGSDVVRYFRDLLKEVGEQDSIDLFLYSRGGELTTPLPIVHLIRSDCKKFNLLIPYKAHSAATLICLGADEIVMGEMGQLSPIDPTTYNVFNPIDPTMRYHVLHLLY